MTPHELKMLALKERKKFNPPFVYIDDRNVLDSMEHEGLENIKLIQEKTAQLIIKLAAVLDPKALEAYYVKRNQMRLLNKPVDSANVLWQESNDHMIHPKYKPT